MINGGSVTHSGCWPSVQTGSKMEPAPVRIKIVAHASQPEPQETNSEEEAE